MIHIVRHRKSGELFIPRALTPGGFEVMNKRRQVARFEREVLETIEFDDGNGDYLIHFVYSDPIRWRDGDHSLSGDEVHRIVFGAAASPTRNFIVV